MKRNDYLAEHGIDEEMDRTRNTIDAGVIAEMQPTCPEDGTLLHYEGYRHQGEYHALAVCSKCGYFFDF